MNLVFRLFGVLLKTVFTPKLTALEESKIKLRVFPNDLDIYGHMNNGRYLTLMDLGRIDLILRTGLGRIAKEKKVNPLVGFVSIRYKKSLKCFHSFYLHTRILGWDEKWFFIEQRFERKGKTLAVAFVKGLFRGAQGNCPTSELLSALGQNVESPRLPEVLREWTGVVEKIG